MQDFNKHVSAIGRMGHSQEQSYFQALFSCRASTLLSSRYYNNVASEVVDQLIKFGFERMYESSGCSILSRKDTDESVSDVFNDNPCNSFHVYEKPDLKLWIIVFYSCSARSIVGAGRRRFENSSQITNVTVFYDCKQNPESYQGIFTILGDHLVANWKATTEKNNIFFLCYQNEFFTKAVEIDRNAVCDLDLNYGAAFQKVHERVLSFLCSDKTGLLIFNGDPGTGKTSYIRHLLSHVDRRVLYMSPQLIKSIADPQFLSFIINYPDVIIVIEDAEEVVAKRDGLTDASVSNLLNITDGILGDAIRVKVVCTFNTALKNIDPALMRKGRLALQHEFGKLSIENTNKLLRHIGFSYESNREMSLAEIYNFKEPEPSKNTTTTIGFK